MSLLAFELTQKKGIKTRKITMVEHEHLNFYGNSIGRGLTSALYPERTLTTPEQKHFEIVKYLKELKGDESVRPPNYVFRNNVMCG